MVARRLQSLIHLLKIKMKFTSQKIPICKTSKCKWSNSWNWIQFGLACFIELVLISNNYLNTWSSMNSSNHFRSDLWNNFRVVWKRNFKKIKVLHDKRLIGVKDRWVKVWSISTTKWKNMSEWILMLEVSYRISLIILFWTYFALVVTLISSISRVKFWIDTLIT